MIITFCDNCDYQVMEIGYDDLYICLKCYHCGQINHRRVQNNMCGCVIRGNERIECNEICGVIGE